MTILENLNKIKDNTLPFNLNTFEKKRKKVVKCSNKNINNLTGLNGFPLKKLITIQGDYGVGKTTLCLDFIASEHKKEGACVFVDSEHTLNFSYANKLGLDFSPAKFIYITPKTAEDTFEIILDLLKSQSVSIIILDSIDSLLPKEEYKNKKFILGVDKRVNIITKYLREIKKYLNKSNTILLVTSHNSEFRNLKSKASLIFYSDIMLELSLLQEKEKAISIRAKVIKSIYEVSHKQTNFKIVFNKGIME